jgi:CO/xanthine dehydrogenase Mo-binding subunit
MNGATTISRRTLLKGSGALVVAFSIARGVPAPADAAAKPGAFAKNPMLDAWIRINTDGTVTVMTGKAELGQGIKTALSQIAAEELDVAFGRIRLITADTEHSPDEGITAGSKSLEQSGTAIRYAATEARAILLDLAAADLGTNADRLSVRDGAIAGPNGARTTYWAILGGRYFRREATGAVAPKPADSYAIVGKAVPRVDIPGKVTGEPSYVQDMHLPGMLHARVVRGPRYGSHVVATDLDTVRAMPGVVQVVRDGDFLAVAAEREEQAIAAAERLRDVTEWEPGPALPQQDAIYGLLRDLPSDDSVVAERGTPDPGGTAQTLTATYRRPYHMHASIGPSCAVAQMRNGQLTVWTHSQGVYPLRASLAGLLGMAEREIHCIHREGSGCYGHNGADDAAADAARIALETGGRPVRLQWMRDDEHRWEPYGSAMVMTARGGLDADGGVTDWDYELWSCSHLTRPLGQPGNLLVARELADPIAPPKPMNIPPPSGGGDRNSVPYYDLPNVRVVKHWIAATPLRVSATRGLGAFGNVFAVESFMDELAHAAGADPLEFRLRHLSDERARAVVDKAAAKAGWRDRGSGGDGRGLGMAFARYKNAAALTCIVARVRVDADSGAVRVEHVWAANDSGQIVNPDGIRNQVEGGIVQSTSWTLKEAVQFTPDGIESTDWQSYPILTFPEVPEIDVALIDAPGQPYLGTGETAQGPTPAAIANAVFHATGARVREIPMTPERVKAAMDA